MSTEPCMWDYVKNMLQALALPGQDQLLLYPDGCCKGDEFALDYDNWCSVLVGHGLTELNATQRESLLAVDEHFSSFSGSENHVHWTEEAILHDPLWEKVRVLARAALEEFGWEVVHPPKDWVSRHMHGPIS